MRRLLRLFAGLALVQCGTNPTASPDGGSAMDAGPDVQTKGPLFQNAQRGDPEIGSAQQIDFGPDGILVVGDGVKSRVVAIDTGDVDPKDAATTAFAAIPDFRGKAAMALGGGVLGTDVQIVDFAVNPITKRLYVSVRRTSTSSWAIVKVQGDGTLSLLDLSDVTFASVTYAQGASIVRDIGWSKNHVVLAATKSGWTNSTVVSIPTAAATSRCECS